MSVDWLAFGEKLGTVGVCIWMLFWFQKRSDTQFTTLAALTRDVVACVDKFGEGMRELGRAMASLAQSQQAMVDAIREIHQVRPRPTP